jgi:hypothetical protein
MGLEGSYGFRVVDGGLKDIVPACGWYLRAPRGTHDQIASRDVV